MYLIKLQVHVFKKMIHGLSILTTVTVQVFNKRPTSFSKYSSKYQTHTFNGQNCGPSFEQT